MRNAAKSEPLDLRWAIAWVSGAYLTTAVLGTWLAVQDGLFGRPFGWAIDMTALSGFVFGLGTDCRARSCCCWPSWRQTWV